MVSTNNVGEKKDQRRSYRSLKNYKIISGNEALQWERFLELAPKRQVKDICFNCNCKYDKLYSTFGGKPFLVVGRLFQVRGPATSKARSPNYCRS